MEAQKAIAGFAALAHVHRLQLYRLLVRRGSAGMAAGVIAERLQLPPSSLTFHLQALQRAGLIRRRRDGRQLIYSSDVGAMNALVGYLTDHCCIESGESCSAAQVMAPAVVRRRARA